MQSRDLGFMSSWKMLTRDKGWIKPVLVLTLVGWIPILGQIATLGYALEWARLTAWGVDSAPKQRGVNYGKVLTTGGIAFLVSLTLAAVAALANALLFGASAGVGGFFAPFGSSLTGLASFISLSGFGVISLVSMVFNILLSTFIMAAIMRSTIYDSFTAGWRLDRLFQMVVKDFGGFMHVFAVSLICGAVNMLYSAFIGLLGGVFLVGTATGMVIGRTGWYAADPLEFIVDSLIRMGPALVLFLVIMVILIAFVGSVISTAMQLVAINAVGQWFCRFDLPRWGVSSAPLPDGVPVRTTPTTSTPPADPAPFAPGPHGPEDEQMPFAPGPNGSAAETVAAAPATSDAVDAAREPAAPAAPKDEKASRQPILLPPVSELLDAACKEPGADQDADSAESQG